MNDDRTLSGSYREYIECLNRRDLSELGRFVSDDVTHNGEPFGLVGYKRMLEGDYEDIPDLHFHIELVVADSSTVGARLAFDCTPKGNFLGLDVDGRRVSFHENVFYRYDKGLISEVWSIIDRAELEAQLHDG